MKKLKKVKVRGNGSPKVVCVCMYGAAMGKENKLSAFMALMLIMYAIRCR